MSTKNKKNIKQKTKRNDKLLDAWSAVHFVTAAALCAVLGPVPALVITFLWEPMEIFIISPVLARWDILFGHETLRNSLSDIVVNSVGVLAAHLVLISL